MSTIKSSDEHLTLNADGTSKDIKLQSNASEKVIIKSDGKVGIGTSSPDSNSKLHVYNGASGQSSATNNTEVVIENNSTTGISFLTPNNASSGLWFADPESNASGRFYYTHSDNSLNVFTDGTQRLKIDGDGLKFNSDTAAANALDDYEEGSGNSSQIDVKVGGTASSVSGVGYKYTKIGNIVHFQFEFRLTNLNGASSGTFSVGLPFTAVNGGYSAGALRIYNGAVDGNEFIAVDSNANILYLTRRVNNSGTANVTASNNAYYFGQLTYTTN